MLKKKLHVYHFWEWTESVVHKCLVHFELSRNSRNKWSLRELTWYFFLMLNSAGRKSHANDCHSVRYKTDMHKRWYIFIIGGLRARTTPWFFGHFWKCSEVVDNYFWRLSKMAEKSRGRSCSEPFNYSLNGRDEDYVIAQSWFFLKLFYFSTWTGSACVQDLIGLILYKYTNQGLQPPLKVQNVSYDVALYKRSW